MIKTQSPFIWKYYNNPFYDSHFLAKYKQDKHYILFDMGQIEQIPLKTLLKVRLILISHTHMDHFIGFAYFLRNILKYNNEVFCFIGPEGFLSNIACYIHSFHWNLINTQAPYLELYEIRDHQILYLKPTLFNQIHPNTVYKNCEYQNTDSKPSINHKNYQIEYCILNHKIPVLSFKVSSYPDIKVDISKLDNIPTGIWIKNAKNKILNGENLNEKILINSFYLTLKEIQSNFFVSVPPFSIGYVTDIHYEYNIDKIIQCFRDCDLLYIESHFLSKDIHLAHKTHHLSTLETGKILKKAHIKQFILHHFSPRYIKEYNQTNFYQEVEENL